MAERKEVMEILFVGMLLLLPLALVVMGIGMFAKAAESIKKSLDEHNEWKRNR